MRTTSAPCSVSTKPLGASKVRLAAQVLLANTGDGALGSTPSARRFDLSQPLEGLLIFCVGKRHAGATLPTRFPRPCGRNVALQDTKPSAGGAQLHLKLPQQLGRCLSIARAHMIGASMSTVDDDVATRRKDIAYDVASSKDPSVQDGILATADEGGMRMFQDNYVASLARGQAAIWFIQPECPHPAATRCV